MNEIIKVDKLSAMYINGEKHNPVIENLSFSVPRNSVFGIVGPSGVGKTSLLRALTCEISPTLRISGTLSFDGRPYFEKGTAKTADLRFLFFVPQFTGVAISPLHTVGQVFLDLYHVRMPHETDKHARAVFMGELDKLDLPPDIISCYPHELSGGMLQRTLLAMGFAIAPEVLILDEPTSALDWESQLSVAARIQAVKEKQGGTMIIVSHDDQFLKNVCTHFLYMGSDADGRQDAV